MMIFEQFGRTFEATNSIKSVNIHKRHDNTFMLFTPEGGLLDEFTSRGPFITFEEAKRSAETHVGVKVQFEQ